MQKFLVFCIGCVTALANKVELSQHLQQKLREYDAQALDSLIDKYETKDKSNKANEDNFLDNDSTLLQSEENTEVDYKTQLFN